MPDATAYLSRRSRGGSEGPIIRAEDLGAAHDGDAALAAAKREAEELRAGAKAARDVERRRGLEEGRRSGKKEAAALIAETALKGDGYLADLEARIAEIVLEAVNAILDSFEPRERALLTACQAIHKARGETTLKVKVPPCLVDDLRRRLEDRLEAEVAEERVKVLGDPALRLGDCILANELGFVDASIETQLAALRAGLMSSRKEG